MVHKVYEDAETSVYFKGNNQKVAAISYSSMGYNFKEKGIPGGEILTSFGYDVFGVVAKRNNWFPVSSMQRVAAALAPRLIGYDNRLSYGSSMGAYGAIKHSARMNSDVTLALAPQYSIDPALVSGWDRRYLRFFDSSLNSGMEINKLDLGGRVVVVADPMFEKDIRHARLIAENGEVEIVPGFGCGHLVIQPLASKLVLAKFLSAILSGDMNEAKIIYRKSRKASSYYRGNLLRVLADRQFARGDITSAARTIELSLLAHTKTSAPFVTASRIHQKLGEYDKAIDAALEAQQRAPKSQWIANIVQELRSLESA
ncbi:tetratricopeptide repeat protein [Paracoccus aestuariivivens]|uniref:Tetratricopeptide repeat protein n=1 Tax=Paracoccus aestuariivivens TaxID=1820333 RepID=A0A6L6J9B3_9RHOB|nr:hypothetical protein [Paracoccus aestuariivivens]MTH78743.1 hypothetical protein [Paracoccus aestuariivivens]